MRSLENLYDYFEIARTFLPMSREEKDALVAVLVRENAKQQFAEYRHPGYRDGRRIVPRARTHPGRSRSGSNTTGARL